MVICLRHSGISALLVVATVCLASSCEQAPKLHELNVSAAVSLKDALKEIAVLYEKQHPDTKVNFNFASSGLLCEQIIQGAPVDIFVCASKSQMEQLRAKGLIVEDSVSSCAENQLVVIAVDGKKFLQLSDLLQADRISIGDPKTVPAGSYAQEALEKANVFGQLKQKQKLVYAENALQALTYVESGDVDAGIVYNTDALLAKKSKISFSIPPNYTSPMVYKIAVLKSTKNADVARSFVALVLSKEGQERFRSRGFKL